jgi:hypothetical protein
VLDLKVYASPPKAAIEIAVAINFEAMLLLLIFISRDRLGDCLQGFHASITTNIEISTTGTNIMIFAVNVELGGFTAAHIYAESV